MRGKLLALRDHLVGSLHDGGAAEHRRARTAGAAAGDQAIAVALHQADAVERNAELVDQQLREGRGMTLSVIERARDDCDGAVVLKTDAAHLGRAGGGRLDITADAEAAHFSGAAAFTLT